MGRVLFSFSIIRLRYITKGRKREGGVERDSMDRVEGELGGGGEYKRTKIMERKKRKRGGGGGETKEKR